MVRFALRTYFALLGSNPLSLFDSEQTVCFVRQSVQFKRALVWIHFK